LLIRLPIHITNTRRRDGLQGGNISILKLKSVGGVVKIRALISIRNN